MTDTSYPFTTIPSHHSSSIATPSATAPRNFQHQFTVPAVDGIHEDEGQISCICGFNDDDGYTVACDSCNRWQHIICYYPQHENSFPDDKQHWCVECHPRPIDTAAAYRRQQSARDQQRDRPAAKTTKKKTKDSLTAGLTNGRHDRNSVSPRDHPPPAKRPKTSHRPSQSTTLANGTFSRPQIYSEHFLRCHIEDNWSETKTNCHTNIAWLQEADEDFADAHGFEKRDVFVRWDGLIEEISHASQVQLEEQTDNSIPPLELSDTSVQPAWKYVTLQGPVPEGACIGELRGHVGLKDEYCDDPSNRWSMLRHPEPFVFFHPKLPIYVDARSEGSLLRYVRRSCSPNARMQIMITEGTEYHFCFMAMRDIEPGEEVAIMWDSQEGLQNAIAQGSRNGTDLNTIRTWVTNVLANCGPCACGMSGSSCMMSRFDRRGLPLTDEDAPPMKVPKGRKKKGQQISPVNTSLVVNSRSGSEVHKVDPDDQSDSRSTSGSVGHGSASRDITPNTHYSANGSTTMPEMSERERKKLAKEEEMFRRQEEEAHGKQNKKKRGSAGSALNTPAATSSKPFNFPVIPSAKYADAGTGKQIGLPIGKPSAKRPRPLTAQKQVKAPIVRVVKKPKPEYTDAEEAALQPPQSPNATKQYISITQRLLERKRGRSQAGIETGKQPQATSRPLSHSDATGPAIQATRTSPSPAEDTEMADAHGDHESHAKQDEASPNQIMAGDSAIVSSPASEAPPAVDVTIPPSPLVHKPSQSPTSEKLEMHIDMPPPSNNAFATAAFVTGAGSNAAQSPAPMVTTTAPPLLSPAVTASVNPGPARKKLSLSDYTKRSKAKDREFVNGDSAKSERESSPASVVSATAGNGPVVPPLRPSSSEARKLSEGSNAVEEDVKMEDSG
ncbi:hypothetical protein K431DRAFT_317205 [Polychaeton citri CBS 116435]|uniref:SET domain-containing protein n=1 Tax=Polychaeton citri CBS 116435 TaxID=1314669 RepID=A0A9P4URK5_9PEZI|nr:hypothetical protein K431DRAFT_317205 [Polychaeton citri CBS 116435]